MAKTGTAQDLGRRGEQAAATFLVGQGLRVLARNWRFGRLGEVDLVFADGDLIVFVEVKTRSAPGSALESVDFRKVARLRRLAAAWLVGQPDWHEYRIDTVAVELLDPTANRARITWLAGIDR